MKHVKMNEGLWDEEKNQESPFSRAFTFKALDLCSFLATWVSTLRLFAGLAAYALLCLLLYLFGIGLLSAYYIAGFLIMIIKLKGE